MALIATAVILGFFVLRNAWDQGVPVVADGDVVEDTSDAEDEASEEPDDADNGESTAEELPPARPPDELTVLVANTTGVGGAASDLTERIAQNGYQTLEPTNSDEPRDATGVFFVEGFEAEAVELAEAIGSSPDRVGLLPDPPPVDPGGAQLVVLLGPDLVQTTG